MSKFIIILLVTLASLVANLPTQAAQAAIDFRILVQQHVDALNRGDVAGVMATFSDDAVVSNVGLCAANPCVGKAAIQREMERRVNIHVRFTITSLQESNGTGLGRAEVAADNVRACGVQRIVAIFNVDVKGDKITSFPVRFDASDAQTAAFLACVAAPAPTSIAPPRTGDAGLLGSAGSSFAVPWAYGLVLASLIVAGFLSGLQRRMR